MRLLVTGATGFIGYNLVKRLSPKGHEITCLVRETSDISALRKLPVRLEACDILDEADVMGAFGRTMPEAVFHCAAAVDEPDEKELSRVNVGSTRNVCAAALKSGAGKLVYLSSIAVINGNSGGMLTDSMPYNANSAYGRSKVAAEIVVLEYRERGLKAAIIRPCMVYGEDEPHALTRILSLVKKRMLPMPDISEIDSHLHLAYVGNVAQLLEIALYNEKALEGFFMVADREVTTPRKFLSGLYEEMGSGKLPMVPRWVMALLMAVPPLGRKVKRLFKERVYDISRAVDLLGYDPEVTLEEGLRRTVAHWKEKDRILCQR